MYNINTVALDKPGDSIRLDYLLFVDTMMHISIFLSIVVIRRRRGPMKALLSLHRE